MTTDLSYVSLLAGPYVDQRAGYDAVMFAWLNLSLYALPDDPAEQAVHCEGGIDAFPSQGWYAGYAGTT